MAKSIDINFSITDGKGKVSRFTINVGGGTSVTNALAFAEGIWGFINPMLNGGNVSATISIPVPNVTSVAPISTSDVEEGAQFVFNTALGFLKRLRLPTFLESLVSPGSAAVDTAQADVAAFITAMQSGFDTTPFGGTGVIAPTDYRSEDLTTLDSAVEVFTKS